MLIILLIVLSKITSYNCNDIVVYAGSNDIITLKCPPNVSDKCSWEHNDVPKISNTNNSCDKTFEKGNILRLCWKICSFSPHSIFLISLLHTMPQKSLSPLASVWSKTTLNTAGVGVAGMDPHSCKMETSFLMSLALRMPLFNNFQ